MRTWQVVYLWMFIIKFKLCIFSINFCRPATSHESFPLPHFELYSFSRWQYVRSCWCRSWRTFAASAAYRTDSWAGTESQNAIEWFTSNVSYQNLSKTFSKKSPIWNYFFFIDNFSLFRNVLLNFEIFLNLKLMLTIFSRRSLYWLSADSIWLSTSVQLTVSFEFALKHEKFVLFQVWWLQSANGMIKERFIWRGAETLSHNHTLFLSHALSSHTREQRDWFGNLPNIKQELSINHLFWRIFAFWIVRFMYFRLFKISLLIFLEFHYYTMDCFRHFKWIKIIHYWMKIIFRRQLHGLFYIFNAINKCYKI